MLSSEMDSQFVTTQLFPQHRFCLCHRPAVIHRIILDGTICVCIGSSPPFSILGIIHRISVFKHPSLGEGLGGLLDIVNHSTDVTEDAVELTQAINMVVDALLLVPLDERLCL